MNKEKGFTLIEFLIVILITGILSVAMITLLFAIIKLWNAANGRLTIYQNLRTVLDAQAYEIRSALRTKPVTNGGAPLWMFKGSDDYSYTGCDRLDIVSATEGSGLTENYNFFRIGYHIVKDTNDNTYTAKRIIDNTLYDGTPPAPIDPETTDSGEQFGMFFTSLAFNYYDGTSWTSNGTWDDQTKMKVPVGVRIKATAVDDLKIYGDPTVLGSDNGLMVKTSVYVPVSTMEN